MNKNKNLIYVVDRTTHHELAESTVVVATIPGARETGPAKPLLRRLRARSYALSLPNPLKFALLNLPVARIALWLVTSRLRNTTRTVTSVHGLFRFPHSQVPQMLTRKQYELLRFIHERLKESGVPPSFEEMKEALDLRSKSGIHRLITALEERGFIRRLPNRARALEVIRLPDSAAPGMTNGRRGFSPNVIEGSLGRVRAAVSDDENMRPVAVPVMGRIAAGTPISAIQSRSHTIHVPPEMLSTGDHFALEVRGDSMIEAGIFEGDLALVRKTDTADTGDIVVALVDEEEATLKRLRKKGMSIALEAANPSYETRIFGPDRVRIQGKLVGIMRRY